MASLAVYILAHQAALSSPLVINDDLRQQLFWMQRWLDPALYPPDLLNVYSRAYVPWGVQLLYRLGSFAANPLEFSKVVTGVLFVAQCLLLMGLGRLLGGRPLAWGALCTGWLLPFFLDNISGGLSRAFASPLLAAMALAWLTRNVRLLGATLLAQALFIPYIFMPCALAVAAERAYASIRSRPGLWLNTRNQCILFAACALLVLAFSAWYNFLGFGPLISLAETAGRPEFGPLGRLELAPLHNPLLDLFYYPFEGVGLFKELGLAAGIASLALLAVPVVRGARLIPWTQLLGRAVPLSWLAGAFAVFYLAARVTAFTLFVPDRYVQYPVNLLYALLLAACCTAAWQVSQRSRRATCLLVACLALLGAVRLHNVGLYDLRSGASVYAGVEASTPKDAMLAGHPELMDNVLTFAKRNALVTFELAHCWSKGYWAQFAPRLEAFFQAYYAQDAESVYTFAKRWKVDFIVVDSAHFTKAYLEGRPFFEPYGQTVRTMTAEQANFALLDETRFTRQPLADGVFLVDVRDSQLTAR